MLEAEMDQKLGYSKYDYQNKETDDSRNGYSHKTVTSSMGDIDLDIPRDRRGEFEPQIVKKHQTDISNIVDEYIDAFKERLRQLKEIQDEAAQKAALEADSDMRATAVSSAALSATANGLGGTSEADAESQTEDGVIYEKNWTKNLKTDDQTVLRTAKEAQEMENKALSRFEEVQLTGTTTVGVSQTDTGTECASVEEDEKKEKVWTITAFGEDGIVSTR